MSFAPALYLSPEIDFLHLSRSNTYFSFFQCLSKPFLKAFTEHDVTTTNGRLGEDNSIPRLHHPLTEEVMSHATSIRSSVRLSVTSVSLICGSRQQAWLLCCTCCDNIWIPRPCILLIFLRPNWAISWSSVSWCIQVHGVMVSLSIGAAHFRIFLEWHIPSCVSMFKKWSDQWFISIYM